MAAYFSRSESEISEALTLAERDIKHQNINVRDAMKKVACSLISTRHSQYKKQEAVYNILPELWLRKLSGILLINKNLQENRIRMLQSKEELEVLSDDSTNVFKQNIIDKYMDQPKNGKFVCLKNICLAQFESYYCTSENDYQPEIIEEDIEDKDNDFVIGLPKNFC